MPGISTLIEDQNTVSSDCAEAAILYSGLLNRRKKKRISYDNCYYYNYPMISHNQWGHQPIQEQPQSNQDLERKYCFLGINKFHLYSVITIEFLTF